MPHTTPYSPAQIGQAADALTQLRDYLRTDPPIADTLPLLGAILDQETGVPILLGDVLRNVARLLSEQAGPHPDADLRLTIDGLREAAQEATNQHVLQWDIQRLTARFSALDSHG